MSAKNVDRHNRFRSITVGFRVSPEEQEVLTIRDDGHVGVKEKPEVIDSQGAVNTPKNITDIIVEETLRPLYDNKTPEEVSRYHIADICCGSGNFLLSAFEYIVNYHIEYYRSHDVESAERRGDIYQLPGSTNYILSYEKKRAILKNNIFGVDIDPLAVEVSKFSLLLKALENSSLEKLSLLVTQACYQAESELHRPI